ncbi:MAG: biotin--[acetyl-CoA-carboxylase] ligase [Candidatus Omnitrophica bacterium]|nr:biotin--[acetyl-CoA-carboxylase] ligase [Candidatus Omnitrophota bacterium]
MIVEKYKVIKFEKVTSTMDIAKRFLKEGNIIILAEEQTEGRGRYGRKWISPRGGLYFSFVIEKGFETDYLSEITALSLIDTFKNFGIKDCKIKFPNDIIINEKKIAGILIEKIDNFYIVGVGVNVKENKELRNLNCITMEEILRKKIEVEEVFSNFIKNFEKIKKIFKENFEYGLKIWSENLLK